MENNIKPQIYFDQNFINKLNKYPDFHSNFHKNFYDSVLVITPYTAIELSGKKVSEFLKSDTIYNLNLSDKLDHQIKKAFEYYNQKIRGDIIDFLIQSLREQKKYVRTTVGEYIFTQYENYLNSFESMRDIIEAIIWDRVFALDFERFKFKDIPQSTVILENAFEFLSIDSLIPIFRLFIKSVKPIKILPLPDANTMKFFKDLIEKHDFKANADLIDIEMIQYAILGHNDQPVHFYTQDSLEKIKARVYIFYEIFKTGKRIIKEKRNKIFDLPYCFGKFSIIDNKGNITNDFDIQAFLSNESIGRYIKQTDIF